MLKIKGEIMDEIIFKRKIYDKLVEWKNKGGITSLLIEGWCR